MAFVPKRGACVLVPSGPKTGQKHLYVLITDACPDGRYLAVGIATTRQGVFHDPACEIADGEHSFVKVDSYVFYRGAIQLRESSIAHLVEKGYYTPRDDVSDALLLRICDGLKASKMIGKWAKDYYDDCVRRLKKAASKAT